MNRRFKAPPRSPSQWPAYVRETPGANVLLVRAFFGVTFIFAGLQKLANPAFFSATDPTGIHDTMLSAESFSPIGGLLGPAVHISTLLGVLIAFGELAVGVGTLLGFRTRLAAGGGMLLSLMFFLTVSWSTTPYYYGADIVFFFAWTGILLAGPAAFSLDTWLADRAADARAAAPAAAAAAAGADDDVMERRAALTRFGATTALATLVVMLGGITAAVGRVWNKTTSPRAAGGGSTTPSGGTGNGGGATSTTTARGTSGGATTTTPKVSTPKGIRIGPASTVPLEGAQAFHDGSTPAYVVHPKEGEYLGFSRVCTHEGCTVSFAQAVQQFQCPCHGSIYSALTGDVISGPAPLPLPKIAIVEGSDGDLYATD